MNTAILQFSREAIIYDVENSAYIVADTLPEDQEHAKRQIIDIAQDGNIDRVNRVIDLAFAYCVEVLFPYTKIECNKQEYRDNELAGECIYITQLSLPQEFSRTTIDFISKLIHEFIVYYVMADWLSLTYPAMSAVWAEKLSSVIKDIKARLNARCGRVRRTQSPF